MRLGRGLPPGHRTIVVGFAVVVVVARKGGGCAEQAQGQQGGAQRMCEPMACVSCGVLEGVVAHEDSFWLPG